MSWQITAALCSRMLSVMCRCHDWQLGVLLECLQQSGIASSVAKRVKNAVIVAMLAVM